MSKNPLKELLNRLIYDENLNLSIASIEYQDFEGENALSKAPLTICDVTNKGVQMGDSFIPFHRIRRVLYGSLDLYPFRKDDETERIKNRMFNEYGPQNMKYYVFKKDDVPDTISDESVEAFNILKAESINQLMIKMGEFLL